MPKVKAINDLFFNILFYISLIDSTTDCFCTLTLNLLIFSLFQPRACSDKNSVPLTLYIVYLLQILSLELLQYL